MNNSVEVLKQLYKPYRITLQGQVFILNTTSGDYVIKKKSESRDIRELFSYLQSRSFHHFPSLVDASRSDVNVYSYISDISMPKEQKAIDLIDVISALHNKTTYYKTVTEDEFKGIYDNIKNNILYLQQYYEKLYENIKKEIYMSPSSYALVRNISKLFSALDFVSSELDSWFKLVKEQSKKRVCTIHNNLSLDHFLKNEEGYLISWDSARTDTPIMDLVDFYQSTYFQVNFGILFERYLEKVQLTEDEKKLFFLLISIPKEITFSRSELENCKMVEEVMDYLYITEELVRPYYAVQQES